MRRKIDNSFYQNPMQMSDKEEDVESDNLTKGSVFFFENEDQTSLCGTNKPIHGEDPSLLCNQMAHLYENASIFHWYTPFTYK